MKYIKQFGIILFISFLGELLNCSIPLPIPSSIYGLLLMLIALWTKLLPLASVKESGKFLIEIMPLMFIPSAVGLIVSWKILKPMIIPVSIITIVSTILVMVISGRVSQGIIHFQSKKPMESSREERQ